MKLTVNTKSFVEAISWVTKNYAAKDDNAYVAMIINKDGQGHLFYASSVAFMKSPFVVEDFSIDKKELGKRGIVVALDGRYLQKLAGALTGVEDSTEISRDMEDTHASLSVVTTNGNFTVPTFEKRVPTEPEIIALGEVDDREYFDALQRLGKLCDPSRSEFNPAYGSVDIKLGTEDSKIVMMATDGYTLGELSVNFEPSVEAEGYVEKHGRIMLPVEDATLIPPSKGLSSSTTLAWEEAGDKFGYLFGDGRVALFSLKDGSSLVYEAQKKNTRDAVKNSFTVPTAALRKAIATITNLAWDESNIYLDVSKEEGLHVGDSARTNRIKVEADTDLLEVEEDCTITFNRLVVGKTFHPVSTAKMRFRWGSVNNPFIVEAVLDDDTVDENLFIFVMPVRSRS